MSPVRSFYYYFWHLSFIFAKKREAYVKVLAISGYKPYELGIFTDEHEGISFIKKAISQHLHSFMDQGLEWVVISGQLGVELWAAEVVLQLKSDYPSLKLAILTPFLHQEKRWKDETKAYYYQIVQQADFVKSITNRPYESPSQLQIKNEFIVSKSDALLLLYDDETDGSPTYYLRSAKKRQQKDGYPIYFITPTDLQFLVEDEQLGF